MDRPVLSHSYKEATKTVSPKEVNGSIIECAGVPIKDAMDDTSVASFIFCIGGDSNNQMRRG